MPEYTKVAVDYHNQYRSHHGAPQVGARSSDVNKLSFSQNEEFLITYNSVYKLTDKSICTKVGGLLIQNR